MPNTPVIPQTNTSRSVTYPRSHVGVILPILLAVLLFSATLYFWKLGTHAVTDTDEATHAMVTREMRERNDPLTLHFLGKEYFRKPPFAFWLRAGAEGIFGETEFALRFFSAVSGVAGLLIAYFVARSRVPGRGALDFVASLPLAIPGTVVGLGFAIAFNRPPFLLTGTALIIVAAFVVRSIPYSIRSGVAALRQVDVSLDEASTSMGATSFQTLWRVILPLLRPAVLAGMIFTFTRSVTTLSAVIFVVSPHWALVTPTILSQMDRGDVGEAAALSVVLIVLVLLVIHGVPRLLGRDWREGMAA